MKELIGCLLCSKGLKNPFFLGLAFGHVLGQLWATSQVIACLVTAYVRRGEKNGNLVHLCQRSLMEPTQLSAAWHRLGQNYPKYPLEVPVGLFHHRVRSRGAPLCTQGSSCPAVFRLLQSMGTSSILFSCMGVVRVFRGWEDQKSLLFLGREGMTRWPSCFTCASF